MATALSAHDIAGLEAYAPGADALEARPEAEASPSGRIIRPWVWLDLETTGLNPHTEKILEIGLVATDETLERIPGFPDFSTVVIPQGGLDITKLNPKVVEIHSQSGLLADIAAGRGCRSDQAQRRVSEWLKGLRRVVYDAMPEGERPEWGEIKFILAGSTVGQFDMQFFKRFDTMPNPMLEEFFHYRVIDVSSFKEALTRWYGDGARPSFLDEENKAHRVIADIEVSIRELAYYQSRFMGPAFSEEEVMLLHRLLKDFERDIAGPGNEIYYLAALSIQEKLKKVWRHLLAV